MIIILKCITLNMQFSLLYIHTYIFVNRHVIVWIFKSFPNFYIDTYYPSVNIWGGGAYGQWLDIEYGVCMESIVPLCLHRPRKHPFSLSCELPARSNCSWKQTSPDTVSPAAWSWIHSLRSCEKQFFVV